MTQAISAADPERDCDLCPRLRNFILEVRQREPSWHNAPVDSFVAEAGADGVALLVVGLAPGLRGANRTGRPFTGDFAGDLLYSTMIRYGFANGTYRSDPGDGLTLCQSAITNAVRCVPPQNKPVGAEISQCRPFLTTTIHRFPALRCVLTLGRIAHESTLRALGERPGAFPFKHGAEHTIKDLTIISSYHCSRYNTNTGRLTVPMFEKVFAGARRIVDRGAGRSGSTG